MTTEKSREARLRRKAARCGYRLEKSRSRDPQAMDFGLYALFSLFADRSGGAVNPAIAQRWVHSWTLDEVEAWFTDPIEEQRKLGRQALMAKR